MSDQPDPTVTQVETYVDTNGEHRWRVQVSPGTPAGTEPDVIAVSPDGYKNFDDMAHAFFRMFFADWDDSFLAFYNKWHPEMGIIHPDEVLEPPVNILQSEPEEQ